MCVCVQEFSSHRDAELKAAEEEMARVREEAVGVVREAKTRQQQVEALRMELEELEKSLQSQRLLVRSPPPPPPPPPPHLLHHHHLLLLLLHIRHLLLLQMEQCSEGISKKMSTVEENQTTESEAQVRVPLKTDFTNIS